MARSRSRRTRARRTRSRSSWTPGPSRTTRKKSRKSKKSKKSKKSRKSKSKNTRRSRTRRTPLTRGQRRRERSYFRSPKRLYPGGPMADKKAEKMIYDYLMKKGTSTRARTTRSARSRRTRKSHSHKMLQSYRLQHLSSGAVDWRDANAKLPHMTDRQKQEVLRVAIIYKNTTMIKKLLRQGIKPMKSYYKFVTDAKIRKLLPRAYATRV